MLDITDLVFFEELDRSLSRRINAQGTGVAFCGVDDEKSAEYESDALTDDQAAEVAEAICRIQCAFTDVPGTPVSVKRIAVISKPGLGLGHFRLSLSS